jgi:hypothetical protein
VSVLKFDKFGGQIPALDERLLPPENAVYTENAFLQAGRLEPLAADIPIHTMVGSDMRYAFRVPIGDPGINNIPDSYWLEFPLADTWVVRSPVTQDAEGGRYYWADGHSPPGYTTKNRIIANTTTPGSAPPLVLGIPRPAVAPGVTVTGGAIPTITRAYVYNWVSAYGEEGQPSPPTVVTGNASGTWHITMTAPTVADTTNRNLTKTHIYRTETGTDGSVGFFFVAELPIATLTFDDNVSSDIVANSEQMRSDDWSGPPSDLAGMVSMPNGMVAGWRANEIWFCEPYRLHAWPVKYMLGVESPIVGLGTIDQNCMVLTAGQPYVATGVHPSVMTLRKVNPLEPCTAPGSIASSPNGVLFTSQNGLILIGPGGGQNLTYDTIRKDEWERLFNLRTIQASFFMNGYYCYSTAVDGVFQKDTFQTNAFQQEDFTGTQTGAHIAGDQRLGLMTLTCDSPTYNVMTDLWTGETFVVRDQSGQRKVFHVDRRQYDPRQSYIWRSKIVQQPYKDNYAAAKVFYDMPLGSPPVGPHLFKLYADGRLKYTRPIRKSGEQFRLPSGYKADFVQFELSGQLMIFNMQIATSAHELRGI